MEKTGERGSERGTHAFGKELNDDVETRRTEHVLLRRRRLIRFRLSTWSTIRGRPMHQLRKLCQQLPQHQQRQEQLQRLQRQQRQQGQKRQQQESCKQNTSIAIIAVSCIGASNAAQL